MKILLISENISGKDGWSRYTKDLAEGLMSHGHEILCAVYELEINTNIRQSKILYRKPLSDTLNPYKTIIESIRLNILIWKFKPDIIQFTVEPYNTVIPFLRIGTAKLILNAHGTFCYLPALFSGIKRKYIEFISKIVYKKATRIFVLSNYTNDRLINLLDSDSKKIVSSKINIIGGGIPDKSILDSLEKKKINDIKEILFVGVIKPRKGIIEAIESLKIIKSDFIFRIVGKYDIDDEYYKSIISKIDELKLSNQIILTGKVSDNELNTLYKNADLFIMLSINNGIAFEGYGLVYLEANGKGVPTIGPNDSGATDAILDGKTGYTVNNRDYKMVASRIDDILINNKIKRQDCLDWANKNRTSEKVKEVLEIYKQII